MSAPIRLWYCAECGPPSRQNSYIRAANRGCARLHGPLARVEMSPEKAAEVAAQFHPDWRAEVAKEQA